MILRNPLPQTTFVNHNGSPLYPNDISSRAIGVGSALGGDFFGWEFVLYGGFLSALGATAFAASFYWLYALSITELAARYRTSGGSFDFVRVALGRRAGALMAVLGLLKLLLANSALALAISSYLIQGGMPRNMQLICWIITYGAFTLLDTIGVRQSANIQVSATVLCVMILIFYSASSFEKFSYARIRRSGLINDGILGFFKGFPFALQFFDGFEEVPLLMGYAIDPEKSIPQAIVSCYITILFIALMILFSGAGITSFSVLIASEAPLMNGIDAVYGHSTFASDVVANLVVVGLLVNFFAFVLFTSQQMQAVAEAGQLPAFLAYRDPVHGAPIAASICSSVVGLILTAGFAFIFGESAAQDTLVTAALMPAVLGYALLLECIVRIREVERRNLSGNVDPHDCVILGQEPGDLRFYWGLNGAKMAQLMCVMFVISLLVLATISRDFRWGLVVLLLLSTSMLIGMEKFFSATKTTTEDFDSKTFNDESKQENIDDTTCLLAPSLPNTDISCSDSNFCNAKFSRIEDLEVYHC